MRTPKNALPNPHNPTYTLRNIVSMSIASTKLVECKRSVKTYMVVFYSIYKQKTLKKPSPGRVKSVMYGS